MLLSNAGETLHEANVGIIHYIIVQQNATKTI